MTPNEALDGYLQSLSRRERMIKVRDIREVCQKTSAVIYDWRHGRSKIDIAWQAKITEALGVNIFTNC